MIRIVSLADPRPQWVSLALLSLLLAAACSGAKREEPPAANRAPTVSPAARVIPAGGPGVSTEAPVVPRAVSYEEAESLFKTGKYSEARDGFQRYVEAKPENPWGHYMLGLSAWKTGDLAGALGAFDAAIARDPAHLKSQLNSARVLLDLGRAQEALERVTAAQSRDSTSESLRLLARVHDELGDPEAAIKTFREALIRNERDAWAMNNLGMLYIRQRDFPAALPPLARAVQLRPGAPVFQNNLGIALELNGHPLQARQAYAEAIRVDSTYAKAIANAKRLGEAVNDSSATAAVSLRDLAEQFRQSIRLWKDSVVVPPDR